LIASQIYSFCILNQSGYTKKTIFVLYQVNIYEPIIGLLFFKWICQFKRFPLWRITKP